MIEGGFLAALCWAEPETRASVVHFIRLVVMRSVCAPGNAGAAVQVFPMVFEMIFTTSDYRFKGNILSYLRSMKSVCTGSGGEFRKLESTVYFLSFIQRCSWINEPDDLWKRRWKLWAIFLTSEVETKTSPRAAIRQFLIFENSAQGVWSKGWVGAVWGQSSSRFGPGNRSGEVV